MLNHLFIGLGGQGGRTLAALRKVMAQRERDTETLRRNKVRWDFLAIDSSEDVRNELKYWTHFGENLSLEQGDWVNLNAIAASDVDRLALRPDIADWIGNREQIRKFLDGSRIEGANQRRRFGRLLFAHNATRVRTALFEQKVQGFTDTGAHQCAFHIFASLGGGTGSGTIVDLVASIRAKHDESGLQEFPIFVYIYATSNDGKGADVGYFYQNQFAALRDLNALICDRAQPGLALNLLGEHVAGQRYAGVEPIAQLIVTTSMNRKRMGVPLANQIHIVAESCFERIFAWSAGQMSAGTQQAMTGQDIVRNFPGEPSGIPERSYRFAGIGMRRWEVPHRKVEELLALDVLASGLRQMLFGNWEQQRGFGDTPARLGNEVAAACLARFDTILDGYAHVLASHGEWARELRDEIKSLRTGMLRKGGADLHELEANVRSLYEHQFGGHGAPTLFQTSRRNQPVQIDEAIQKLDAELTALWLDGARPVALAQLFQLLDGLDSTVRGKLGARLQHGAADSRLGKLCAARHHEWSKITALSGLAGKRSALLRAQADDLGARCVLNLLEQCEHLDEAFLKSVLMRLSEVKAGYRSANDLLENLLVETEREIRAIEVDLQAMHSGEGANKYEFDAEALGKFRPVMKADDLHQREAALALRMKLAGQLHGRPLTSLRTPDSALPRDLAEQLRKTALEHAKSIHQDLERSGKTPRILQGSLLRLLEARIGAKEQTLKAEVSDFVARAASCLNINSDPQPVTVLGRQIGITQMPKRVLLLGLPSDHQPFANRLKDAFLGAHGGGEEIKHDTYSHEDPTQLRLLLVDYWLAARLTSVAHELAVKYQEIEGRGGDTAYFCNLDPAGEAGRRPSLFLLPPEKLREQFAADLWLAQQPELKVLVVDENGVTLMRPGTDGAPEVTNLGRSLEAVSQGAHQETMMELRSALNVAILSPQQNRQALVSELLKRETDRILTEKSPTSPEYLRWQGMKSHLQSFAS